MIGALTINMPRAKEAKNIRTNDIGKKSTITGVISTISKPQIWVKEGTYLCGERDHVGLRTVNNPLSSMPPILHKSPEEDSSILHDKTCRLIPEESVLSDYQVVEFVDSNLVLIYESKKPFQYEIEDEISLNGTVELVHNPRNRPEVNYFSVTSSRCRPVKNSENDDLITGKKRTVRNLEKAIMEIVAFLSANGGGIAQLLDIFNEAERYDIDRATAEDVIDKLCQHGRMLRPSGYDTLQIA